MTHDNSGLIVFVMIAVVWGAYHNEPITTHNADLLSCVAWDASGKAAAGTSSCRKMNIDGSYHIAINKTAGTCTVLYRSRESGLQTNLEIGQSVAYIDDDNWECKLPPTAMHLQEVFRMNDGDLSLFSVDTDGMIANASYNVSRSDGIWGRSSHYWRIARQFIQPAKTQ